MYIHTREQLVEWLESYAPTRSTQRAVRNGCFEVFGLFRIKNRSYIVVSVWSHKTGKEWLIAITFDMRIRDYASALIKDVPWQCWCGDQYEKDLLKCGDNPREYAKRRK